jgi:hypothetical protein
MELVVLIELPLVVVAGPGKRAEAAQVCSTLYERLSDSNEH